ncbi:GNAT family N-acetyltransferase [Pseudomonadota bacterium]
MEIRKASLSDCRAIAELALIASEGMTAYFWEQSRKADQEIIEVGVLNAASECDNFSYRNAYLALIDNEIAGMLLAYRLPNPENAEDLKKFPEFLHPLIELEQCVPNSFYLNMLATYPQHRNKGIGKKLMSTINQLAVAASCTTISIEVFEQNEGALRLYQRLGYHIVEQRDVVPHACHPYEGKIFLLTKNASVE